MGTPETLGCSPIGRIGLPFCHLPVEARVRHLWAVGLLCGGLAACAVPSPFPPPNLGAAPGNLNADRQACNRAYPPKLGNYLPHAQCVNEAVERDAIPFARHPDLVRLQEQLRVK